MSPRDARRARAPKAEGQRAQHLDNIDLNTSHNEYSDYCSSPIRMAVVSIKVIDHSQKQGQRSQAKKSDVHEIAAHRSFGIINKLSRSYSRTQGKQP